MHITAKYGQDRESTEGIYRLIELDLEPHDQGLHDSTWNALCAKEYNTMDDGDDVGDGTDTWEAEARRDISAYTGVDEENIVIE